MAEREVPEVTVAQVRRRRRASGGLRVDGCRTRRHPQAAREEGTESMTDNLLPGERIGLSLDDVSAGDSVEYLYTARGGYGFSRWLAATVVKVTRKRVTISLAPHHSKNLSVEPRNLRKADKGRRA